MTSAPSIPAGPCVYCGKLANEIQFVRGIAHASCFHSSDAPVNAGAPEFRLASRPDGKAFLKAT